MININSLLAVKDEVFKPPWMETPASTQYFFVIQVRSISASLCNIGDSTTCIAWKPWKCKWRGIVLLHLHLEERVKIFLLGLVTSGELYERMFFIEIYLAHAMVFSELTQGSQKTPKFWWSWKGFCRNLRTDESYLCILGSLGTSTSVLRGCQD